MSQMLLHEPGWKLERKGSALLLRRDSSLDDHHRRTRVCFRCDVEVREYERDEEDYYYHDDYHSNTGLVSTSRTDTLASSPLAMCASCLAAICVTVVLPWLLIGG